MGKSLPRIEMGTSRASRLLPTLAFYVVAIAWLTWPLAARIATVLPAVGTNWAFDPLWAGWALSWQSHALVHDPRHILAANIYHPMPHALLYGPTGSGALLLFAPAFLATGNPTFALNVMLLLGLALTACGLHRVVARWSGSEVAGLVAAWAFLDTRWALWTWVPTTPFYAALFWFPWIVLSAASLRATRPWRRSVALGLLITLQGLTDPVYVAPAVFVPLGLLALVRIARRETRSSGRAVVAALGIGVLGMLPVYLAYLMMLRGHGDSALQTVWQISPQVLEPLGIPERAGVPMVPPPMPWNVELDYGPVGIAHVMWAVIVVGAVLRIASSGSDAPRDSGAGWRHAAFWTAAGFLLSVPAVRGFGKVFVLPQFEVLATVAPRLLQIARAPQRLGIGGLVGLSLMVGMAFGEIDRVLHRHARAAPLAVAFVVLVLAHFEVRLRAEGDYPVVPAIDGTSRVVELLRAGSGPVLELSAATTRNTNVGHARAMYRSIFHWRPILNGYGSYFPAGYLSRMATVQRLPDPATLALLRSQTGLRTIVVQDEPGLTNRAAWQAAAAHAERGPLALVGRDGDTMVFEVRD